MSVWLFVRVEELGSQRRDFHETLYLSEKVKGQVRRRSGLVGPKRD